MRAEVVPPHGLSFIGPLKSISLVDVENYVRCKFIDKSEAGLWP
jgi:hypothetical protein